MPRTHAPSVPPSKSRTARSRRRCSPFAVFELVTHGTGWWQFFAFGAGP